MDRERIEKKEMVFTGIPASPGIAFGEAFVINVEDLPIEDEPVASAEVGREIRRFEKALGQTERELTDLSRTLEEEMGKEHAKILDSHILMLADETMRDAIEAPLHTEVVVDTDLGVAPLGVLERVCRQRLEDRAIQLLEQLPTRARQLLEWARVELSEQLGDGDIELTQGEKALVAQPCQDPAFDHLDGHFGFGLVFGFVGPCRQDRRAVMAGQLQVGGVGLGVVTVGCAHRRAQVVRDQ